MDVFLAANLNWPPANPKVARKVGQNLFGWSQICGEGPQSSSGKVSGRLVAKESGAAAASAVAVVGDVAAVAAGEAAAVDSKCRSTMASSSLLKFCTKLMLSAKAAARSWKLLWKWYKLLLTAEQNSWLGGRVAKSFSLKLMSLVHITARPLFIDTISFKDNRLRDSIEKHNTIKCKCTFWGKKLE